MRKPQCRWLARKSPRFRPFSALEAFRDVAGFRRNLAAPHVKTGAAHHGADEARRLRRTAGLSRTAEDTHAPRVGRSDSLDPSNLYSFFLLLSSA